MKLEFTKMHGLGNDFMVIDNTSGTIDFSRDLAGEPIRNLADRRFGVGFDQLLVVGSPTVPEAQFDYRIYNADGAEVEHCGNGARCFAAFVRERGLTSERVIPVNTCAGMLSLEILEDDRVKVLMGVPVFDTEVIPFLPPEEPVAQPGEAITTFTVGLGNDAPVLSDTECQALNVTFGAKTPVKVEFLTLAIGNPHMVIRVDDVHRAPVEKLGAWFESHPMFPNRVNVGFLQVNDRHNVHLRVFERGVGETLACGSGACAAVAAATLAGWIESPVEASLTGGNLTLNWPGNGEKTEGVRQNIEMTGPCTKVFEGCIEL